MLRTALESETFTQSSEPVLKSPEGMEIIAGGKPEPRTLVSGEASPPESAKKRSDPEGVAPRRGGATPSGSVSSYNVNRGRRSDAGASSLCPRLLPSSPPGIYKQSLSTDSRPPSWPGFCR